MKLQAESQVGRKDPYIPQFLVIKVRDEVLDCPGTQQDRR
jgi:hypothetical protein